MAKPRMAIWVSDLALIERFEQVAAGQPLGQAVEELIRQFLDHGGKMDAASEETARALAQYRKERQRQYDRRRAAGRPVRDQVRRDAPPNLDERVCLICDDRFLPTRSDQKFCTRGNRRCMKYAQRNGVELGRKKYAAKAHTFTD